MEIGSFSPSSIDQIKLNYLPLDVEADAATIDGIAEGGEEEVNFWGPIEQILQIGAGRPEEDGGYYT